MVSFGHAAYLGIGGYVVGILAYEGISSGFVQWPLAILISALFALGIGALSLRTRGVYFIMITLAFAQMVYYVAVALSRYGADDGLTISRRSQFAGLARALQPHGVLLCLPRAAARRDLSDLAAGQFPFRHGDPAARAQTSAVCALSASPPIAIGSFVSLSPGRLCGLAGALLANFTNFISPAMMHWTRSGDLIVMVVLGGMGSVFGPTIGAVALLVLEETLPLSDRASRFSAVRRCGHARGGILADRARADAAGDRAVRPRRYLRRADEG